MSGVEARELDLSLPSDVLTYLSNTPYKSTRVEKLSGGTANFTYRLYLESPYDGNETLVLKHGKSWLAFDKNFEFSIVRQIVEAICLRHVKDYFPSDSLIKVPTLYHHDRSAHVLIMEDAGPTARTLKSLVRDSDSADLSDDLARAIGAACGTFLATVHTRASNDAALADALRAETDFEESKRVVVYATYGQIIDALRGRGSYTPTLNPPLAGSEDGVTEADVAEIGELVAEMSQSTMDAQHQFIMGDFWTGNVLVRLKTEEGRISPERIYFVDWEVSRFGLQSTDYAQLVAEMHLLRRFHPHTSRFIQFALESYTTKYKESVRVDEKFIQCAAIHVGTHLIAWTPVTGWEPKERVREVVKEGTEYLLKGKRGERTWMKSSIVGSLFGHPNDVFPATKT